MNETGKNSVLIVDDENSNILALTHILSPEYLIYAAKSGEGAIKAAEKHNPDIILLDIIMSDMDGFEVITELKKSRKTQDIPIIFVTGMNSEVDEEKGFALGAADYITKPFSTALVKLRVKNQIKLLEQFRANKNDMNQMTSRIEAIIGNLPGMVYSCLYDFPLYSMIFVSEGCKELIGYTPQELIGKKNMYQAMIHPEDINDIQRKCAETLERDMVYENTNRLIMKDGSIKWVWERSRVMKWNPDGTPHSVEGYVFDITEQKQLEAAEMANRAKSAFLANMSHELRTPLNVVIGLTDLILEENTIAKHVSENLHKIGNAGSTLLSIVNDILDFSKIESGNITLMPIEYHLSSLLNDVIALMNTRIAEKPVVFKLNINENLPSRLIGDELRVKQILNNLLSNAFKYTETGTIELTVNCVSANGSGGESKKDVWMEIIVSDTGIGISKENLKKLFTDYYQVQNRISHKIEGTGLGLSITKRLVQFMGGDISIESELGKGTIFHVRIRQEFVDDTSIGSDVVEQLSRFHYADDKRRAGKKLPVRADLSFARVLVVDDMQTNLDVAAGLLRKYKMQVDCVTSGQEAIDLIHLGGTQGEPVFNAIFMDHMMPDMDGIETTDLIRGLGTEYAEKVPIIALTANAIKGTADMFFAHGFQEFLPKPIDITQLDSVVRKWICR